MPYDNHKDEPDHGRQEHFDKEQDWLCGRCFKTVSANRPPVLNLDNCSCQEAGKRANDPNSAADPAGFVNSGNGQDLPSYPTSSDGSVETPNGPETRDPNNHFLPVAPEIGLGELRHRRRASSDETEEQRDCSIRRWRDTLPLQQRDLHRAVIDNTSGGWLRQNIYMMGSRDSVIASRGGSGTPSILLSSGSSGSSSGLPSSGIDPVLGAGDWADISMSGGWPDYLDEEAIYHDDGN
jgi:hypothetical protein